jgi:hypothetical protein
MDAVANAAWKLMGQPNLNLESDQAQIRLRSDRPDIGSAAWNEFTSL